MKRKLTRMRLGEGLEQSKTDWARVDSLTDEQIAAAIANDPDTFDPGAGFIARNRDALNESIRQSRKQLGKGVHSSRTVDQIVAEGRSRHKPTLIKTGDEK
jgi:hypothetical protein